MSPGPRSSRPSVGVMLQRHVDPALIPHRARLFESLGFDDVWVVEDRYFSGGIAQAGAVLSATERVAVGIGILPAVVRNPVFAAMELATLAGIYPGRLIAGIGHGMKEWMRTVGAVTTSPLAALEETLIVIGGLLRGETVSLHGRWVNVEAAVLEHPPSVVPGILAGVRGPKSLALAGRVADGVILAEPTSPAYARWAAERMAEGVGPAGGDRRTLVAFCWLSVDADSVAAVDRMRPLFGDPLGGLREPSVRTQLLPLPYAEELLSQLDVPEGGEPLATTLRSGWISDLAVAGSPAECAQQIRLLSEAGVDTVVMVPIPDRIEQQTRLFGETVLPLLA